MNAPVIRRATPRDLEFVVDLHRQFCVADDHPFRADRARTAIVPLLADDRHGVIWLVEDPPAYAAVTWGWSIEAGGGEAVLDEILVTDRGAGLGRALVEHLLADVRARGMARVFLETERHNDRARALYRRLGFREDDSIWMSHELADMG